MAEGADDDALVREAKALPLPERLAHANWRVRVDAYADVVKEAGCAQVASAQPLKDFGARQRCRRSAAPASTCKTLSGCLRQAPPPPR